MLKAITDFVDSINISQGILPSPQKQIPTFDFNELILPFGASLPQREPTYGDPESLNKLYEKIIWVYRCVNILAINIARLPYRVVRIDQENNEVDISDRPEYFVLFHPNKFQTKYDFIYESVARLNLQGELFWELQLIEGSNRIAAMYSDWMSQEITVNADANDFITGYERVVNGESTTFDPEQVFFIKFFNPFSVLRGMAPLRSGRDTATLELNAVKANKNFFAQGMRSSAHFSTEQKLQEEEARRLQATIQEAYGSTREMYKPVVTWGGIKFDPLSNQSLRDAEYTELRKMNREDICAVWSIPLEAVGLGQRTFENLSKAERLMWNNAIIPQVVKIEAMINSFFIPRITNDPKIKFRFDLSDVEALQEDRSQKMSDYEKGFKSGAITPNDIRVDVFNKEPLEIPGMDDPYIPATIFPVGSPPEPEAEAEAEAEAEMKRILSLKQGNGEDASTFEKRTAIWKQKIVRIEVHERKFEREMKRFFRRQEREVISNLEETQERALKQLAKRAQKQDEDILREGVIFDTDRWEEELRELGNPLILDAFLDAVEDVMENLDDFDMTHPSVRAALTNRTDAFAIQVNETTRKEIEAQLREGFAAQESVPQLADRLRNNVFSTQTRKVRARRIARTEAVGASNNGIMEGIRQSAQHTKKMWITSRDERVRDTHRPLDGVLKQVDEFFNVQGEGQVLFPSAINERCIVIPRP